MAGVLFPRDELQSSSREIEINQVVGSIGVVKAEHPNRLPNFVRKNGLIGNREDHKPNDGFLWDRAAVLDLRIFIGSRPMENILDKAIGFSIGDPVFEFSFRRFIADAWPRSVGDVLGRGLADGLKGKFSEKPRRWGRASRHSGFLHYVNLDPSAKLVLIGFACDFVGSKSRVGGATGFSERHEDQAQPKNSKSHSNNGRYANGPRSGGHDALGFKVAFIALSLIGGLAFGRYAVAAFRLREREAFAFYSYVAGVGIGISAFAGFLLYLEMRSFS